MIASTGLNLVPVAPRARRWRLRWWMLLALFGTPSITGAEPATSVGEVLAELELSADTGCATRADLVRRIQLRSDRIRFVTQTPGSRLLRARISSGRGTTYRATLTLVQPGRGSLSRSVVAKSCAEAIDALALIAAVSLDASASTEPVPEDVPSPSGSGGTASGAGGAAAGATSSAATAGSSATNASIPAEKVNRPPPATGTPGPRGEEKKRTPEDAPRQSSDAGAPAEPVPPAGRPSSPSVPPKVSLGVLGGILLGPAPELMPGASAFVALHWEDAGLWSPALRLSIARHLRKGLSQPGGTAEFSLNQLAVEACPLRLLHARLSFHPCLLAVAGQLYAAGSETEAENSETRPWWSVGASALLFLKGSERFLFIARLTGGYPIVRDTFEFRPQPFHEVPPITLEASLGVGFRFQ